MSSPDTKLFTDPGIAYPIHQIDLAFSDYITQCKKIIQETRVDLQQNAEKIINANAPFELPPKQSATTGVLLIHGLMDSAFLFKEIGELLQAQGYLVRSVLLPGHGTVPGALLNVDFHDWLQTVNHAFRSLSKVVDRVYLMGFSTGANLAVHQAIHDQAKIAGLILLSPAIRIHSPLAFTAKIPTLLSKQWQRLAWFHKDTEETIDYAKYRSLPYNAIYQVYRSTQALKKINSIKQPLFFVVSDADKTVNGASSLAYFKAHQHPSSRLLLYSATIKSADDSRITLRNAHYPDLQIRDFSHVSLPFSKHNSHYGIQGDYPYGSHLPLHPQTIYGEFSPHELDLNRVLYSLNMTSVRYQRVSFNPDFSYMIQAILEFIEQTLTLAP